MLLFFHFLTTNLYLLIVLRIAVTFFFYFFIIRITRIYYFHFTTVRTHTRIPCLTLTCFSYFAETAFVACEGSSVDYLLRHDPVPHASRHTLASDQDGRVDEFVALCLLTNLITSIIE